MINLGEFTQGEIPAPLEYTFKDANGNPISFLGGGYNGRVSIIERWSPTPIIDNAAADVPNDATGRVIYTWTAAAFAQPGEYFMHVWAGNGSNRFASDRITYRVRDATGTFPSI